MTGGDAREARVRSCIPAMLRERARLRPDDTAFDFVDYAQDPDGVRQTLTWSQLYRRALSVAQALRVRGSTGDRALILAPHGPDYVVAFLGALQAGLIAVPLSLPLGGASDELFSRYCATRSPPSFSPRPLKSTASKVRRCAACRSCPLVVYVDWLDLDFRKDAGAERESWPATAYLQYHRGPPVRRLESLSRTATCWPISSSWCPTISVGAPTCRRATPPSSRGCPSTTTWA